MQHTGAVLPPWAPRAAAALVLAPVLVVAERLLLQPPLPQMMMQGLPTAVRQTERRLLLLPLLLVTVMMLMLMVVGVGAPLTQANPPPDAEAEPVPAAADRPCPEVQQGGAVGG